MLLAIYVRDHATAISSLDDARRYGPERFGSYLVRSHNDGKSWGEPWLIAPAMDETGLIVLPDGGVLALLRGTSPPAGLWSAHSADGGSSWSEPVQVTVPEQVPADLVQFSDGSVLLAYGNRNPPYRIEGRITRDGGRTWLPVLLTFSGPLHGSTATSAVPTSAIRRRAWRVATGVPRRDDVLLQHVVAEIGRVARRGRRGAAVLDARLSAVAITWDEEELLDALGSALEPAV